MNNKYTLEKKTVYTVITPLNEKTFEDLASATKHLESVFNTFKTYNAMYIAESVMHVPVPQLINCKYSIEYRTPESDAWQGSGGGAGYSNLDSKEAAKSIATSLIKSLSPYTQFRYKIVSKYADDQQKVSYEPFM